MLYFYLLDQVEFSCTIHPALLTSWQKRSFLPCRELCKQLIPRIPDFLAGRPLTGDEPFLVRVAEGTAFDRRLWQHLVGEVLLYAAVEVPRIDTSPDALCCLVAADHFGDGIATRDRFAPIQQAHLGTRDLVLGGGYYRPDHAGWNGADDVARLHDYLSHQDPSRWDAAALEMLPNLENDVERNEELEYARGCLESLRELYGQAMDSRKIIVCEVLGE